MPCANRVRIPRRRWLLTLLLAAVAIAPCAGDELQTYSVELASVDASAQIAPEPQGGSTLKPWSRPGYQELKDAIWRGKCAAILANGADPNATSPEGEPILFLVLNNRGGNLEFLLKAGADPNGRDQFGCTPLSEAIFRGNVSSVELLLRYGADPELKSSGKTVVESLAPWNKEWTKHLKAVPEPLKPEPPTLPPRIRHPDAVYGSRLFRQAFGGEALVYSADSRQIIAGDRDGAIRFFDARTGEIQNVIAAHQREVCELARVPGTDLLASTCNGELKLWHPNTSRERMRLKGGGRALCVSPSGRWIFSGKHLWRIDSLSPLRLSPRGIGFTSAGKEMGISWAFFTPDDRYLIFGVYRGNVCIFDTSQFVVHAMTNLKTAAMKSLTWGDLVGYVDIAAATPEDLLALSPNEFAILVADTDTLKAFRPILEAGIAQENSFLFPQPRTLACSPDGQFMASMSGASRIDVYDLEQGGKPIALHGHTNAIGAVAVSPDGSLLATAGGDLMVRFWDQATGQPLEEMSFAMSANSLSFSPDGAYLAIGSKSRLYLVDLASGHHIPLRDKGTMNGLSFNATGDRLFALSSQLMTFDVNTREKLASIPALKAQQRPIAVTPDGLIFGGGVSAWRLDENHLVPQEEIISEAMNNYLGRVYTVAVSPDGSILAASGGMDGAIKLWDLANDKPIGQTMYGHTKGMLRLSFSPDGKRLASASWDGTARVWEIPTGRPLLVLDADVGAVSDLAFLPDGSLVTGNALGTAHLWDLNTRLEDQRTFVRHESATNRPIPRMETEEMSPKTMEFRSHHFLPKSAVTGSRRQEPTK